MIVLDTDVVSELMKPAPSAVVSAWVRDQPGGELYTTAITLAEVLFGIQRLPDGGRKELLRRAALDVFAALPDRILPFDSEAAEHYADIVSGRERLGMPTESFDGQIAAICRAHDAVLATRSLKDFQHTGISLIDPWQHR